MFVGAGKSTTMSMLTGLLPPSSGDASIRGLRISDKMLEIRNGLGVCPQHDILFPELTVRQHLRMFAVFKGVPAHDVDAAAERMIAEVGLKEKADMKSATLSGGQKRKLSVGIALIGDSKVVILDEPTSGGVLYCFLLHILLKFKIIQEWTRLVDEVLGVLSNEIKRIELFY